MLTENQIRALPERIAQRLSDINTEYLESIGEVLKKIGELRPSDIHKLKRLYDYGADMHRISLKLAEVSKKNINDIYEIFDIIAKDNYFSAEIFYEAKGKTFIPYEENENLKSYVKSLAKQTVNEYVNITQHTAFAIFADKNGKSIAPLFSSNKNKVATSLSDTYTKVIDYAVTKVQTGVTDYNSAIREVVNSLADSSIRTVDYATGYSRRLDTAVRQNVLWGIKQCNQNTADFIGEEFGADGYEISYHSHPRPSHADMGGKSYAIGKARTVNGIFYPSFSEVEELLQEYNCLHFKFPILLGISQPAIDKNELEQLKAEDKKVFGFEGKEYTKYEASQLQRKIENEIRHQKDRAIIAKTVGARETQEAAQMRINLLASKYSKLSKASGLSTKVERMQVKGFKSVKLNEVERGISKKIKNFTSENIINLDYINSKDYKNKFNNLPFNKRVNAAVYKQSKSMLQHRNGTYFEDISLIDSNTGQVLITSFNNNTENEVLYSKKAERIIKENEDGLISVHNHGTNNPPTGSDLVSAGHRKYKGGVVACHNGDVYWYKVGNRPFSSETFSKRVDNYMQKGYNEREAFKATLNYYKQNYGIDWGEV